MTQLKAIKTQASSKVGCLSLNVATTFVIRVIRVSKRKVAWPSSLAFTDHPGFNSSLLKLAGFVLGSPKSTFKIANWLASGYLGLLFMYNL